ncbi:MAG: XylR family transcriptional regulator [Sedimentisphaerales bacterium]|nr:XylR family transcriptional regulator [Sedimentisphaerales bacterium]
MDKNRKIILMLDSSRAADRGIIRGIVEYSHLRGYWSFYRYSPLFRTPPFTQKQSVSILQRLQKLDADGIIGYIPSDKKLVHSIIRKGFPAVSLPIRAPIDGLINIQQDEKVGAIGAEHFLERGFEHFAFCGTHDFWSIIRRQGFSRRIEQAGFSVRMYSLSRERKKREFELNRMARWLGKLPKPVAIMTSNDERSADLVEACHINNLKIPEQVAILGVDNDEMICGLSSPPLSSIKLNFEKVGYQACRIIDKIISNRKLTQQGIIFHPMGIVTRQSSDILAITDQQVASAVRFIRGNARRNIHVRDVVNHSTLSIRALQQRFKKYLGRGINQEIRRIRIQQFAEMLLKTNLTVYQIAHDLQIEDINHISRVFKQEMGYTPIEYRKRQLTER